MQRIGNGINEGNFLICTYKVVITDIFQIILYTEEVRCSSMVRALAHGCMGHRIDHSWWTH